LNHGERSVRTSEAAACAGRQGRFWHMHETLFALQNEVWATGNDQLVALMQRYAQQLDGLDQDAFAQCMNDRAELDRLQANDAEQRSRGITLQPIFEIGGMRLFGARPIEEFAEVIEQALP
jgi:protein-disulfide isomerase